MTEPSRFETNPAQVARNRRGVELCRAQIKPPAAPEEPARHRTRSDEIHDAALARAIGERRTRRLDPTAAGSSFGATLHQIRSTDR